MAEKDYKLVVVQGVKGGVGNTTVTSNLAVALKKIGYNVLVFDFCKSNDLRLHFGMGLDRTDGLHKGLLNDEPWTNYVFEDRNSTVFFPFGEIEQVDILRLIFLSPDYINDILNEIDFESQDTIVLIDYPSYNSLKDTRCLSGYDLKINVGTCEVSSYSKFISLANSFTGSDILMFNRYNPERKIESDIRTLISSEFDPSKVLGVIFEDEFIHQALAQNTTIVDLNEYTKSSKDFYHLTMKLSSMLFASSGE
jgi:cellulose synthase operon protein YhjQ